MIGKEAIRGIRVYPCAMRGDFQQRIEKRVLLQIDGSRHDWLEGRGPWLSLIGAIDDATGKVPFMPYSVSRGMPRTISSCCATSPK